MVVNDFIADNELYEVADGGQAILITPVQESFILRPNLYAYDNYIYSQQNNTILIINENNEKFEINIQGDILLGSFYLHQNNLYFDAVDGLYTINGIEASLVIEYVDNSSYRIRELSCDRLLVEVGDSIIVEVNDGVYTEIEKLNNLPGDCLGEGFIEVGEHVSTNTFYSEIYSLNEDVYYELPENIALQNLIQLVKSDNGFLLLTSDGFNNRSDLNIYETNNQFTEFELVSSFISSNNWPVADFLYCDNEGILYIDDELLILNEQFEFAFIDSEIVGDPQTVKLVSDDDYFYFIGISEDYGRQLYRSAVTSKARNLVVHNDMIIIEPFANPLSNTLTLNTSDNQIFNSSLTLIDYSGRLIRRLPLNSMNNNVDVSFLSSGAYIYYITDNEDRIINIGKFVKM